MKIKTLGMALTALFLIAIASAIPVLHSAGAFSDTEKSSIEKIIKDYILKNPEILRDALIELEKRQIAQQKQKQQKSLAENADKLFRSKLDYVAGNPDGNVTVVEFFDYNCGFCKRAVKDMVKLLKSDKNVRVVFKELPIFGKPSEEAARYALASIKQDKYLEFHFALLQEPGKSNEAKALRIANKLGLDIEKLKADSKDPSIDVTLSEARSLADAVGLQGTPLYLVGDKIIPGAPEDLYDQLVANVNEIRTKGCSQVAC